MIRAVRQTLPSMQRYAVVTNGILSEESGRGSGTVPVSDLAAIILNCGVIVVVVALFAIRARTDRSNARFRIVAVSRRRPFDCQVGRRRRDSRRWYEFGVAPTGVAI